MVWYHTIPMEQRTIANQKDTMSHNNNVYSVHTSDTVCLLGLKESHLLGQRTNNNGTNQKDIALLCCLFRPKAPVLALVGVKYSLLNVRLAP